MDVTILMKKHSGPWSKDLIEYPENKYSFEYSELKCEIVRSGLFGNWNGYVTLPDNHVDINKGYEYIEEYYDLHGGLTYSNGKTIGFDTNHYGDLAPSNLMLNYNKSGKYWTFEETKRETIKLADQIIERYK